SDAAESQPSRALARSSPSAHLREPRCASWRHQVGRAVRPVPVVVAVGRVEVSPATGGLGAVVSPAQGGEVGRCGLAGWSVRVVRDRVVEVAGPGGDVASGEDAVVVAQYDEVAHPRWWVVGVDGVTAGHVEDGL